MSKPKLFAMKREHHEQINATGPKRTIKGLDAINFMIFFFFYETKMCYETLFFCEIKSDNSH